MTFRKRALLIGEVVLGGEVVAVEADRTERVAQFVRRHADEIVLIPVQPLQFHVLLDRSALQGRQLVLELRKLVEGRLLRRVPAPHQPEPILDRRVHQPGCAPFHPGHDLSEMLRGTDLRRRRDEPDVVLQANAVHMEEHRPAGHSPDQFPVERDAVLL